MNVKTNVEIEFEGLPKQPNQHALTVALEEHILKAVDLAMIDVLGGVRSDVVVRVHVPELK